MFWGCLDLIMVYHDNSANPVLSDYTYQLVLIVAVMLAFYSMSGFLFSTGCAPRFFVSAGAAVYLALTNAGGLLVWKLRANSDLGILRYFGRLDDIPRGNVLARRCVSAGGFGSCAAHCAASAEAGTAGAAGTTTRSIKKKGCFFKRKNSLFVCKTCYISGIPM